jgi:hypothetical protein
VCAASPAMQVSEGTFPVGSMWRRNPIPACNCDSGKSCGVNKTTPSQPAYPAYYKVSGPTACSQCRQCSRSRHCLTYFDLLLSLSPWNPTTSPTPPKPSPSRSATRSPARQARISPFLAPNATARPSSAVGHRRRRHATCGPSSTKSTYPT